VRPFAACVTRRLDRTESKEFRITNLSPGRPSTSEIAGMIIGKIISNGHAIPCTEQYQ